jgi:hypothetical protein
MHINDQPITRTNGSTVTMHVYEGRPRTDHRGVDLISDVLPFGRLWYDTPDNAIGYAMHHREAAERAGVPYNPAFRLTGR